jgi:hypothetical protein
MAVTVMIALEVVLTGTPASAVPPARCSRRRTEHHAGVSGRRPTPRSSIGTRTVAAGRAVAYGRAGRFVSPDWVCRP